jgi:hypothetical protein
MKLIQIRISEIEYELLRRRALAEGRTMQAWLRSAIRARLLPDELDAADPLFSGFPVVQRKGPKVDVAKRHDEILYGPVG